MSDLSHRTTKDELSLHQLLKDCALFNLALGTFIVGTAYYNAEIWINDYPPDIKEKFGPPSKQAKQKAVILAVPFFLIMVGGLVWSNLRLKRANGGHLSVSTAFLNGFALIFSGWFLDLTILDWLVFVRHTPKFMVLPGTEGMAGYDDYTFHLKEHMRALPMLTIPAGIIALFTASRSRKGHAYFSRRDQ